MSDESPKPFRPRCPECKWYLMFTWEGRWRAWCYNKHCPVEEVNPA